MGKDEEDLVGAQRWWIWLKLMREVYLRMLGELGGTIGNFGT